MKENLPYLSKNRHKNILSSTVTSKTKNVPLDDQILALISFSRYICMKKKPAIIIYCTNVVYEP